MKKKRIYSLFIAWPSPAYRAASLTAILLAAACLIAPHCKAQTQGYAGDSQTSFSYRSELDSVKQAGFYKIGLMPDLIAKCREDLSDLRIADKDGKFIPYVLKSDLPVFTAENFVAFPILFNEKLKDSTTEVVIGNNSSGALSSLLLVMKNSSVQRQAILSGSDDRKKWFVIREHIELEEAGSDTADHYVQAISFPSSSYHYFKLILDDKGLLPLNILGAGITTYHSVTGRYLGVPYPALIQNDSADKHSYITVQYRDSYRIDKLELILKGPVLFKRHAWVYDNGAAVSSTGEKATAVGPAAGNSRRLLGEIELSPGNTSFQLSPVKTKSLILDIANGDNRPLVIQAVKTSELNQYLLSLLAPGDGYSLLAGDPHALAPEYDLKYFTDKPGIYPHELGAGLLRPVIHGQTDVRKPAPDHSNIWLWGILILVLLLLAFLSLKMAKAIPKRQTPP